MSCCPWRKSAAMSSARGLLTLYAVPGALAAASVTVDVLLQAATQFLFAIVGLLC